jgi:hypothetical protein
MASKPEANSQQSQFTHLNTNSMNRYILMLSALLLAGACQKETVSPVVAESESDYLVFGHFFGFCGGEKCIEIFKLTDDRLFEDTTDTYPQAGVFYDGRFVALSQQKFEAVKDIRNAIPQALFTETDNVIGIPDAGDWGGFYIEYKAEGVRKVWLLDTNKQYVPADYHAFIDLLREKIDLLQ